MKKFLFKCVIVASVLMIFVGCSNPDASTVNGKTKRKTTSISKEKAKGSTTEKENEKTIQAFLKVEITGPSGEFKKAFELKPNQGPNFTLMNAYNKKYFEPLLSKEYYKEFINHKYQTFWLMPAYQKGYQFKVKNIKLKKQKDEYNWTAEVDYTKDGITKTSTVNGLIDLDETGKIAYVRFLQSDNGIWKVVMDYYQPKKKAS